MIWSSETATPWSLQCRVISNSACTDGLFVGPPGRIKVGREGGGYRRPSQRITFYSPWRVEAGVVSIRPIRPQSGISSTASLIITDVVITDVVITDVVITDVVITDVVIIDVVITNIVITDVVIIDVVITDVVI